AGILQVPVVIRNGEDDDRLKLELAIIENLQREDLNAVDRAVAFQRLAGEFGLKHGEIGKRVGKSREYVSNTLRILMLPQDMQEALRAGEITEGHTRPLLMLTDRPQEQKTFFKELITRRISVRDAEQLARRIATDRVRKMDLTPELLLFERELTEKLGTRVRIEKKEKGGKVLIDFFSVDDLAQIRAVLSGAGIKNDMAHSARPGEAPVSSEVPSLEPESVAISKSKDEKEDDLYSISNFTV
ncbi:MAG TPA: ParB/RepB/Spo0J family partition protein, partial [Candidatus Paceibacterota bacterium]